MSVNLFKKLTITLALCCCFLFHTHSQPKGTASILGTVFEETDKVNRPLGAVSLSLSPYGIKTTSDQTGRFAFQRIRTGSVRITASYVGKVDLDTVIYLEKDTQLDLILETNSFRLQEVKVSAQSPSTSPSSSSLIGRNAIEHLQANSLADVLALVPGGLTVNPDLTGAKQINIRNVINSTSNANAFGTSIVINGAPVSNNANLQTLSPVHSGGSAAMSGGAPPSGGFDVRNISMYNVESVEVVRGIPDVKYGDVASGTVIVNQRAGQQPLIMEGNTNPHVYSVNVSKGLLLDRNKGALNLGAEYAYNTNDPVQSYWFYQRSSFNALYSNSFFHNKFTTHTGLILHYGKDTRRLNPDDEITRTKSSGKEQGFTLNSSGTYRPKDNTWVSNIAYAGRIGLTDKNSHYQEQYTAATAAYGMTYQDGAVLSNTPNMKLYDQDGLEITRIFPGDENKYAVYLPSTYLGIHDIQGREFNAFISVSANFFNWVGNTGHSWSIGTDFKSDKNFGEGKQFADSLPPYRNLSYVNSSYRNRTFSDIPALNQFGAYMEDNMVARLGAYTFNIKAGLRYDRFSEGKQAFSPRVNFSSDILPRRIVLRGGYGLLAKSPSLLYLYPENAYFDYVNLNEMGSNRDDALFVTTTKVFNTENKDLKIGRNEKMEAGLDFTLGKSVLNITLFQEKLRDGYGIGHTIHSFQPVQYVQYERVAEDRTTLQTASSHPVLAKFQTPHNNNRLDKWGLEYQLNLARIDAIRTQFSIYGAHIQQKSYSSDFYYYDGQSSAGPAERTHIGLYAPDMAVRYDKSTVTAIKATHNIAPIGLVVTLTTDIIWNESDRTVYGNDSIPVKYISKYDGLIHDYDVNRKGEEEFNALLRPVVRTLETTESLPAMVNFNINVTKEIRDFMRVSFFANNMFRHYPIAQSDRIKSVYYERNIPFFFGFRVGVKI